MKIIKYTESGKTAKAIVTRAKDGYDLAQITHPILLDYAKRCKADFIIINEDKLDLGHFSYEIFQCYDLFETYDRIFMIDSDAIVIPNCPDVFDIVPYDNIGVVYEDKLSRKKDRRDRIRNYQKQFGSNGWVKGYINTGAIMFSKCHKEALTYDPNMIWNSYGYDDVVLGYNIHKYGFKVYELSYKFNHMSMFSETGRNWLKSYIIHYAGRGFSRKSRFEQIQSDLRILQSGYNPLMLNFYNIPERLRLLAIGILNFVRG